MKLICPFCTKTHKIKMIKNIKCNCSAKFYILAGYWLSKDLQVRVDLDFTERLKLNKLIANYLDSEDDSDDLY